MDSFTQGTKEYYVIDISDETQEITSLVGATITYDIKNANAQFLATNLTGTLNPSNPMELWLMLDTTINGAGGGATPANSHDGTVHTWWAGGVYEIYVKFSGIGSEAPMLGPFSVNVDAS